MVTEMTIAVALLVLLLGGTDEVCQGSQCGQTRYVYICLCMCGGRGRKDKLLFRRSSLYLILGQDGIQECKQIGFFTQKDPIVGIHTPSFAFEPLGREPGWSRDSQRVVGLLVCAWALVASLHYFPIAPRFFWFSRMMDRFFRDQTKQQRSVGPGVSALDARLTS
jgi:hypothetical protein